MNVDGRRSVELTEGSPCSLRLFFQLLFSLRNLIGRTAYICPTSCLQRASIFCIESDRGPLNRYPSLLDGPSPPSSLLLSS